MGAIALVAALLVVAAQRGASQAAAQWGTQVWVLQAQRDLEPGRAPAEADVAAVAVPSHLVPTGALVDASQLGALTRTVPSGALLAGADLANRTIVGPGRRGVGIPVEAHTPQVEPGTAVELLLFGELDPFEPVVAAPGRVPATVISTHADGWVVDVSPVDAVAVAQTALTGQVVPVLTG